MSRKLALIIGNTEYSDPGLAQLTAPGKDAEDFAGVIKDQHICAFDEVNILINENATEAREAIDEFFARKRPDDLLVLYFSGHGVRDEYGSLYLAVKNTNRDRLRSTAINSSFIREGMDQSRSRRQVLILDCCNSGAFAHGTKAETGGSMGTATAFEGTGYGRVVLTASDTTQFAWEGDQLIGETQNSLFTHFLVKGLKGEADRDGDGRITIDELYDYAYEQIVTITPKQTPGKWSYRQQGEIVLRQNIQIEDKSPVPFPEDLIGAINSSLPFVREGAVRQLEGLLNGRNLGLARSARLALEKIAEEDDSRRVSQLATQVLEPVRQSEQLAAQLAEEERIAAEKAHAELIAREKAERLAEQKADEERIAKARLEEERQAREVAEQKAEEERLTRKKAEIGKPAEQVETTEIKKETVWKIGKQQVWKGLLGATIFVMTYNITLPFYYIEGIALAILVFFGFAYGPWVGLITGLVGELILTLLITMRGFLTSPSLLFILPMVSGALGLVIGLATSKLNNFRHIPDLLKVIGLNALIVFLYHLFKYNFAFRPVFSTSHVIIAFVISSMLLIIMMQIFAQTIKKTREEYIAPLGITDKENIDEEESIWKFGRREVLRSTIGIGVFALLYFLLRTIGIPYVSSPAFTVHLFFGLLFGPVVGAIVGACQYLISTIYTFYQVYYPTSSYGFFDIFFVPGLFTLALEGFIMGLAKVNYKQFRSIKSIWRVELFVIIALITPFIVFTNWRIIIDNSTVMSYFSNQKLPSIIGNLVLIPLSMIVFSLLIARIKTKIL